MSDTNAKNYHGGYMKDFKKFGFTLAEVLITLGVIGVVAAITMPTLIQNYRKKQVAVQLQKAYSEISQAIKLSEIDNGPLKDWNYQTAFNGENAADFTDKYLVPYLKIIKNCRNQAGCMNGDVYSLSGLKNTTYTNDSTSHIVLSSGNVVGVTLGGTFASLHVVINNKKDKIYMGKDVFFFAINGENSGNFTTAGANIDNEELKTDAYGCNQVQSDGAGMSCSTVIMRNGWEIPDDYPVRF